MNSTVLKTTLVSSVLMVSSMVQAEEVKIPEWLNRISFSGLIEVQASSGDTYAGANNSDIALATLAIGLDARVNKWTDVHVVLLHEDDTTEPKEVDEAIITLSDIDSHAFYLSAGRMYVPFGHFDSNAISDPMTLELGETREAAVMVGYENNGLYASLYSFNGATNKAPAVDDQAEQYGLNLGYRMETETMSMDTGIAYISSISDSDTLTTKVTHNTSLTDYVAGMSVHLAYNRGSYHLFAEYLAAIDNFASTELAFKSRGAEPKTYNLEVGYSFDMNGRDSVIALGMQGSDEALAVGLPETRYIAALSSILMESTSLALELKHDVDYTAADGGTGKSADTLTVQLAVEF
ncbi:MAG: LbtU family siderophore porin [Gammaproteobacteria bacterium]|nr:LbtU family siderophore porin [Gammaproteobacteria bacterium]